MPNRSGSVPTAIYNSPLDDWHDEGEEEDALDVFLDDKIPTEDPRQNWTMLLFMATFGEFYMSRHGLGP